MTWRKLPSPVQERIITPQKRSVLHVSTNAQYKSRPPLVLSVPSVYSPKSINHIPLPRSITALPIDTQITHRASTFNRKRLASRAADWSFTFLRSNNLITRLTRSPVLKRLRQRKLALLLPGHNEELIIATTIRSAIAAGQNIRDIYVVDDCSSDNTRQEALSVLNEDQVLTVDRSGKAVAVKKAIQHFGLEEQYQWLHVADADSVFGKDYFRIYKRKLNPKKYAVAVGFVQSLRGNWISTYRAASYTYSQHVSRRIQSKLGMISVFPGPITCFRTDILKDLDFEANSLTEDFDITLQVHRKKLGKILFIPGAVNYTQDPQTFRDFCKQNLRWQRGFFQGVKKYKIGRHAQAIDASIGWQIWQAAFYLLQMFVFLPLLIWTSGNWLLLPYVMAADFVVTGLITLGSSAVVKRWNLLGSLPYCYFLRWVEIGIFVTAFVEIFILHRFQTEIRGWGTEGRRYKLDSNALKDAAVA